jgi:hypothetical protein
MDTDSSPKLKLYSNTKGYYYLPFEEWSTIEKIFSLFWKNAAYSMTIDYCHLDESTKILDVKAWMGKDGQSLERFFLGDNDWNRILPIWEFISSFLWENPILKEKGAGRILVKLSKTYPIDCTLIA